MQSTKTYNGSVLELHYYFDKEVGNSDYQMYNDNGSTINAFENGNYEILEFKSESSQRYLEFEFNAEIGKHFLNETKEIELVVHNISKTPKTIKIGSQKVEGDYNINNLTLRLDVTWNTSTKKEIKIKLNK